MWDHALKWQGHRITIFEGEQVEAQLLFQMKTVFNPRVWAIVHEGNQGLKQLHSKYSLKYRYIQLSQCKQLI